MQKLTCTLLLFLLSALSMTQFSCTKETGNFSNADDKLITDYLISQGMHQHDFQIGDDFVTYQEDAGWDKESLLKTIRGEEFGIPVPADPEIANHGAVDRQRGIQETSSTDAVSASSVLSLKYYIRSSVSADCGAAWVTAIADGVAAFNAASYCRVSLSSTTSQSSAHIVFGSDADTGMPTSHQNLPSTTVARAGFPSGGVVWKWISINDTQDNWGSKKKTVMHEIGHCVGYRHTGTTDGMHIHGTPTTDANSIMNQGSNTSPAWTDGDNRSLRLYYPDNLNNTPGSFTATKNASGSVKITYRNINWLTKPYYWIRVYRYNSSGSYLGYKDYQSNTDGSGNHTLYWSGLGAGTFRFAIRGYNFRRDLLSSITSQITVTL